jgi:hypothetical protein
MAMAKFHNKNIESAAWQRFQCFYWFEFADKKLGDY